LVRGIRCVVPVRPLPLPTEGEETLMARSSRADVRNPLMQLPSARQIAALSPEARAALRNLLLELRADARQRAEKCWRTHKAPMAAYWKAVAVYAGHTARLAR
jgi:hypothetical protein